VWTMKKKRFALRFSNENGFTLLESIFVLMVLSFIFSFFPPAVKMFGMAGDAFRPKEDDEWNLFVLQLRKEIRMSTACEAGQNRLTLNRDGKTVVYEPYGALLRRRVDDEGHQIVLQNVKNVKFTETAYGIELEVEFLDGTEETADFTFSQAHPVNLDEMGERHS